MFNIDRPDDEEEAERKAGSNISSMEVESFSVDSKIIFVSTEDEIPGDAEYGSSERDVVNDSKDVSPDADVKKMTGGVEIATLTTLVNTTSDINDVD